MFDFLKKKKPEDKAKEDLIVPPAPPTAEELPELPSEKEIPDIDLSEAEPKPVAKPMPVVKPVKTPKQAAGPTTLQQFEAQASKDTQSVLDEREDLHVHKPIFVSITSYKDMVDEIGLVNNILKEGEDTLTRVGEFKEDQDKEYHKWEGQIKDIQKKLIYADKTLFG